MYKVHEKVTINNYLTVTTGRMVFTADHTTGTPVTVFQPYYKLTGRDMAWDETLKSEKQRFR
jgi:hypothetical protein